MLANYNETIWFHLQINFVQFLSRFYQDL